MVVGQYSLIFNDLPYERRYQVVSIIPHENYVPSLKTDNLAVIEVGKIAISIGNFIVTRLI